MRFLKSLKDLRYIFYLGSRYECPCCGGKFRKFLKFGAITRLNARCPKCGSLERHRLFWLYYKNMTNLFEDKLRVLHFAPEYVFYKRLKRLSNLDYITADISPSKADVTMSITDIKFNENSFDVILCNDVLEHILDDKKALSELHRVLKYDGGWAIIQVPLDKSRTHTFEDPSIVSPQDREKNFGRYDHVRVYGIDYLARLQAAGFDVSVISYINTFNQNEIEKYNLNTDRDIYLCTKRI